MSGVTTHVLDTSTGRPATGVAVRLERNGQPLATGRTDDDGRWNALDGPDTTVGAYRLVFATGDYFTAGSFHPQVGIDFTVDEPTEHHHVPLLLSPYGYTTYRGS